MRIKFDKQYLKYYTYAVLGIITIILFYQILDNLGFVLSGILSIFEYSLKRLLPVLAGIVWIYYLFRPMRFIKERVFTGYKGGSRLKPKLSYAGNTLKENRL